MHTVEDWNMAFVTTDHDVFMGDANVNELSAYQWITDTGATTHVTSNWDMLTNYVSRWEEVLGVSASPVLVMEYGDLQLKNMQWDKITKYYSIEYYMFLQSDTISYQLAAWMKQVA